MSAIGKCKKQPYSFEEELMPVLEPVLVDLFNDADANPEALLPHFLPADHPVRADYGQLKRFLIYHGVPQEELAESHSKGIEHLNMLVTQHNLGAPSGHSRQEHRTGHHSKPKQPRSPRPAVSLNQIPTALSTAVTKMPVTNDSGEPRQWDLPCLTDPMIHRCPGRQQPEIPAFGDWHVTDPEDRRHPGFRGQGAMSFHNLLGAGPSDRLMKWSKNGNVVECSKALDEFADKNMRDMFGNTALITSCTFGYTKQVERLVASGVDHSIPNQWGLTALHTAAFNGHPSCVKALLKAKASADVRAKDGRRPIDMCHSHSGTLELLR